jgi:hypothetical protein
MDPELKMFIAMAALAVGGTYACVGKSTPIDTFTTKNMWCRESFEDTETPENITIDNPNKELDHILKNIHTGDAIVYGDLELVAVDSRPQTSHMVGNAKGHETMIELDCNGYISFDIYYKGELVPGGDGVEIVYAGQFLGNGYIFDGYPDFTLEQVLKRTNLNRKQRRSILSESAKLEKKRVKKGHEMARKSLIEDYSRAVNADPEWKDRVEQCNERFPKDDQGYFTIIRNGDTAIGISKEFNECNSGDFYREDGEVKFRYGKSFFPEDYHSLDIRNGDDVCLGGRMISFGCSNNTDIYPGQKMRINDRGSKDAAEPFTNNYIHGWGNRKPRDNLRR